MMTAQNQRRFMEVARDAGATYFLAKPFTAETLASRITTIDAAVDAGRHANRLQVAAR